MCVKEDRSQPGKSLKISLSQRYEEKGRRREEALSELARTYQNLDWNRWSLGIKDNLAYSIVLNTKEVGDINADAEDKALHSRNLWSCVEGGPKIVIFSWRHLRRQMLKAPPVNPRVYIYVNDRSDFVRGFVW